MGKKDLKKLKKKLINYLKIGSEGGARIPDLSIMSAAL